MKIKELKINSFGKLHNIDINLQDNINVIYGENESGKSTIVNFILNSLYGNLKKMKGKDISNYEKYKPWKGEDFSGKLKYKLDNEKYFEIYRDFNKKNPKIFNENLEDISKEFNIDKNKGNEFFYEQTKIDEELFLSTSAILQNEVKIEKSSQTTLIQKIANLVGTGDDNVSFKRAMERIERRQLNEIGTERSKEKPINLIKKRMDEIEHEITKMQDKQQLSYNLKNSPKEVLDRIAKDEVKYELLKEIKKLNEARVIENEKVKIQEKLKEQISDKINLLKKEINNLNEKKINNKNKTEKELNKNKIKNKKIKNKLNIFFIIIILINILQFIFIKKSAINYIFLLTVPTYLGFYIFAKNKIKNEEKELEENINKISNYKNEELINLENELKLLEKNKIIQENEINKIKNNFNFKFNLEKEKIKNNFSNKIEEKEIININNLDEINYLLEEVQKEIYNDKIKLNTMDLQKKDIEDELETRAKLEEELSILSEKYVNLKKLNSSMELAKNVLKNSYQKMKETVTPKFTEQLSTTISKITARKIRKR